jgi:hypothetical protein
MSKIIFISNGQKTLRCSAGQLDAFTSQTDGDGKPVWTVVSDPNPPTLSAAEIAINDHTNQIAITHIESRKESWCDKGQLELMLSSGWKRRGAAAPEAKDEAKDEAKEKPESEVAEQDRQKFEDAAATPNPWEVPGPVADLRKTLEGLPRDEDKFWKANGEVNITGLRDVVPNITRKEVDEAFPGFNRTA